MHIQAYKRTWAYNIALYATMNAYFQAVPCVPCTETRLYLI
jgi:hypothetical protein